MSSSCSLKLALCCSNLQQLLERECLMYLCACPCGRDSETAAGCLLQLIIAGPAGCPYHARAVTHRTAALAQQFQSTVLQKTLKVPLSPGLKHAFKPRAGLIV